MSGGNEDPIFERLMSRFNNDIMENVRASAASGALKERGSVRIDLRNTNNAALKDIRVQM